MTYSRSKSTGALVFLYRGDQAIEMLPEVESDYLLYCEKHGNCAHRKSQAESKKLLSRPQDWCLDCSVEVEEVEVWLSSTN